MHLTLYSPDWNHARRLALALVCALLAQVAMAENSSYYSRDGLAIEGYDPVAYFTESKARLGSSEHSYEWMDATWRFASAANREAFMTDPERYAPQYGGYCAWAAAQNYLFEIDPMAFSVYKDKLYLNAGFGTRVRWALSKDSNIAKGDKNWPGLRQRLP